MFWVKPNNKPKHVTAIRFNDGSISYNKLLQEQLIRYLFENLILSSDSLSGTHVVWALMGIDQGLGTSTPLTDRAQSFILLNCCWPSVRQLAASFSLSTAWQVTDEKLLKTTAIAWVPESTLA